MLKAKIFLANNLPTGLFLLVTRVYRLVNIIYARLPASVNLEKILALRISSRIVSSGDRKRLAEVGQAKLGRWNEAFEFYEGRAAGRQIDLAWVHKPIGGNFGDWLSPYLVRAASGAAIRHQDLTASRRQKHIVSLGSIISRANGQSVVLGSGINSRKDSINPAASFLMVRGYITRDALPPSARRSDLLCCDPGFFIREVYTPKAPDIGGGGRLLIPHINHWKLFNSLGETDFRLRSANLCHPKDIERLVDEIAFADIVITSAMHVFVTCCAYGVRCALIKPRVADITVPGDGIKYRDCMTPVMDRDFSPTEVDVRKGIRLDQEVEVEKYQINYSHISRCYREYSSILQEF